METRRRSGVGGGFRRRARAAVPRVVGYLTYVLAVGVVALPVLVERAVETVSFDDRLGTFPVEVSLCHNGRSTLDTGILGKVYWDHTGPLGLGAYARTTGPPEAGGTLASYVDPTFIKTNVALIHDPDDVVAAYSARFRQDIVRRIGGGELVIGLIGGSILYLVAPHRRLRRGRHGILVAAGVVVVASTVTSVVVAGMLWQQWSCTDAVGPEYPMPGIAHLSFSSPQVVEIAEQVQPFVQKNIARTDAAAADYEAKARESFLLELDREATALAPREGETIVLAEADPQGSFVGTRVREELYRLLLHRLAPGSVGLRTIAGDITSNGTVAESSFLSAEAKVAPDVPVAVVAGDHDSVVTWQQLGRSRMTDLDNKTERVGGLLVSGANDREHKSLFGGMVTNDSGITELQLGQDLRSRVDDKPRIVLLHQPAAVAGYLGVTSIDQVRGLNGSLTYPYDDGIPDVPPGIVDYGHLHDLGGPWVLWNTDGVTITWTVVDQLGTAGGVENHPTFNRFSTPFSAPLKPLTFRLQYVKVASGLETGYATVVCDLAGGCRVSGRTDVGLPGGMPMPVANSSTAGGT